VCGAQGEVSTSGVAQGTGFGPVFSCMAAHADASLTDGSIHAAAKCGAESSLARLLQDGAAVDLLGAPPSERGPRETERARESGAANLAAAQGDPRRRGRQRERERVELPTLRQLRVTRAAATPPPPPNLRPCLSSFRLTRLPSEGRSVLGDRARAGHGRGTQRGVVGHPQCGSSTHPPTLSSTETAPSTAPRHQVHSTGCPSLAALFPAARSQRFRGGVFFPDEDGRTPLHWAADLGKESMVRALVAAGAAVNVQDAEGMTPLHCAAVCEHRAVCRVLLAARADATLRDQDGDTAAQAMPRSWQLC
jgi:hypothetical protein